MNNFVRKSLAYCNKFCTGIISDVLYRRNRSTFTATGNNYRKQTVRRVKPTIAKLLKCMIVKLVKNS